LVFEKNSNPITDDLLEAVIASTPHDETTFQDQQPKAPIESAGIAAAPLFIPILRPVTIQKDSFSYHELRYRSAFAVNDGRDYLLLTESYVPRSISDDGALLSDIIDADGFQSEMPTATAKLYRATTRDVGIHNLLLTGDILVFLTCRSDFGSSRDYLDLNHF
jgi:hypothetical protein